MIQSVESPAHKRWRWWSMWGEDSTDWYTRGIKRIYNMFDPYFIDELFKLFYKEKFEIVPSEGTKEQFYDEVIFNLDSKYIREITAGRAFMTEDFVDALLKKLLENTKMPKQLKQIMDRMQEQQSMMDSQGKGKGQGQGQKQQGQGEGSGKGQEQSGQSGQGGGQSQQDKNEEGENEGDEQGGGENGEQEQESETNPIVQNVVAQHLQQIVGQMDTLAKEALEEVQQDYKTYSRFGVGEKSQVTDMNMLRGLSSVLDTSDVSNFLKHFASSGFAGINLNRMTSKGIFDSHQIFDMLTPEEIDINPFEVRVLDYDTTFKLDFYIDISGSMSSEAFQDKVSRRYVSRLDLAKALVYMLSKYVDKIYSYDTVLKQFPTTLAFFMGAANRGGTDTNICIRNAEKLKRHSLIITDSDDNIDQYSRFSYVLSVTNYIRLTNDEELLRRFLENGQLGRVKDKRLQIINRGNYNDARRRY